MIISGTVIQNTSVYDLPGIVTTNLAANYDPATGISGSTFIDTSGNGFNATLFNSPSTAVINGFKALQLNGTNQYFYYTPGYSSALLGGIATFDIWYNSSQTGVQQGLVSEYGQAGLAGGWQDAILGLTSTNMAGGFFNSSTGGFISGSAYSTSTWYNLVITRTSTQYFLYINGTQFGTPLTTTRSVTPSPLYYAVGYPDGTGLYLGGGGNGFFKGFLGAVKFYSSTLTAAQIQQNYNALKSRYGL